MKIALGADHAGYELKEQLKHYLIQAGYELLDEGTTDNGPVDYPDIARLVGRDVVEKRAEFGVLVCGTGIGMAIAANKISGVRSANVITEQEARLSREHNDANVLALGARLLNAAQATKVLDTFLHTAFAHGRHATRVEKIAHIEQEQARTSAQKAPPSHG